MYRCGETEWALEELEESIALRADSGAEPLASDLAFLVLARVGLDRIPAAEEALGALRELPGRSQGSLDEESAALISEAESAFEMATGR